MENIKHRFGWMDFIQDFGDALGGISIGYAIGKDGGLGYAIGGVILILSSVYLRFYHKK